MSQRTRSSAARRTRVTVAVVGAALAAGLLSGCSVIDGLLGDGANEAPRDENGEITEASDADAMTVEIGDCLDIDELKNQETFTKLPVKPCDEEHTGEIYAEKNLDNGTFPGEKAVTEDAADFCEREFENFVGTPYSDSKLYYWSFYPTEESWAQEDRTIQCVLESKKPVTGTLRDAKR